jgi:deoxyribodipyrimidine photo-lyase
VVCHGFDDSVPLPPGSVLTGNGEMYKVFTPFKNAFTAACRKRRPACVAAPKVRAGGPIAAGAEVKIDYPQTLFDRELFAADEKVHYHPASWLLPAKSR